MSRNTRKKRIFKNRANKTNQIKRIKRCFPQRNYKKLKKMRLEELKLVNSGDESFYNDDTLISCFGYETVTVLMNFLRKQQGYNMFYERIICVSFYLIN